MRIQDECGTSAKSGFWGDGEDLKHSASVLVALPDFELDSLSHHAYFSLQ